MGGNLDLTSINKSADAGPVCDEILAERNHIHVGYLDGIPIGPREEGMKRKPEKSKRWASVSALATAALAASSGAGEAAIIFHPTPGLIIPTATCCAFLPLAGGKGISVGGGYSIRHTGAGYVGGGSSEGFKIHTGFTLRTRSTEIRAGGVGFRTSAGTIAAGRKGLTFYQIGHGTGGNLVGRRSRHIVSQGIFLTYYHGPRTAGRFSRHKYTRKSSTMQPGFRRIRSGQVQYPGFPPGSGYPLKIHALYHIVSTGYSPPSYTDQFALFRFNVGSQTDYGWLELSLQNGFDTGPTLAILGYAYDTSGKPIPAGAIPEPRQLPLALAALALGAVGVRELRAKRKAVV